MSVWLSSQSHTSPLSFRCSQSPVIISLRIEHTIEPFLSFSIPVPFPTSFAGRFELLATNAEAADGKTFHAVGQTPLSERLSELRVQQSSLLELLCSQCVSFSAVCVLAFSVFDVFSPLNTTSANCKSIRLRRDEKDCLSVCVCTFTWSPL